MKRPKAFPAGALLVATAIFSACSPKPETDSATDGSLFHINVQLDWVAEPEHGGFYTAQALGYFEAAGLDVTLTQGGPNSFSINKVATGQAQIGQADSTNVILAIEGGAPLLNIASIFQNDPSVLMMQESNPIQDWQDLDGKIVMARPEWAFIPYLKSKYNIDFDIVPQNFELGRLISDPTFVQQGFYIAEPFFAQQQGVELKFLYAWDTGFDAYTTLFANKAFINRHPEKLKALLAALQKGYRYYIEEDPEPAHKIMLEINSKVTPDFLAFSRQMIIDADLHKHPEGEYLEISKERYQTQLDQLRSLNIIPQDTIEVGDIMSDAFLPAAESAP